MTALLHAALEHAVSYLLRRQSGNGHWEDYQLPVGASDAWVTAYVAFALSCVSGKGAKKGLESAARWLLSERPYPQGWGYNHITGPDADSTALATLALRAAGADSQPQDNHWLRMRWQPSGGCATYPQNDAWGQAHPDVTPVAFIALCPEDRSELTAAVTGFLRSNRRANGSWPSYWWKSSHYSTWWNALLWRELGLTPDETPPHVGLEEQYAVDNAFDLACVLGIATVRCGTAAPISHNLVPELLSLQLPDGSWPGTPSLRVTETTCYEPWRHPQGRTYIDRKGLVTTATAVRALSSCLA